MGEEEIIVEPVKNVRVSNDVEQKYRSGFTKEQDEYFYLLNRIKENSHKSYFLLNLCHYSNRKRLTSPQQLAAARTLEKLESLDRVSLLKTLYKKGQTL